MASEEAAKAEIATGLVNALAHSNEVAGRGIQFPAEVPDTHRVVVGKSDVIYIFGKVDAKALTDYLSDFRTDAYQYKPRIIMNTAFIALGVSVNDDFVGCGCPKAFKEFSLLYLVDAGSEGQWQFVPDHAFASHPQRRVAMATKFGTLIELGNPDHTFNAKGERNGFYLKDLNGKVIVRATHRSALPKTRWSQRWDWGFHSLGGMYEGSSLAKKFFRIVGDTKASYSIFGFGDKLEVAEDSAIGAQLKQLRFKPLAWQQLKLRNGKAWIPVKQNQ